MKRYLDALTDVRTKLGYGLRTRLREGYTRGDLRADVMAGIVVGVVALPLSMALAIACKVPPQHGLYTAIIAGVACALLGGTRAQVTGPTAAFIVILEPIVRKFGLSGLLVAGLMAGVILVAMGLMKLGRLMTFIPHPVTTGFTTGIAVVIATLQIKDFVGLDFGDPHTYAERWMLMWGARATWRWQELAVGAASLGLLLLLPRYLGRKWPRTAGVIVLLACVGVGAGLRFGLHTPWLTAAVATLALLMVLFGSQLKLPAPLVVLAVISAVVFVVGQLWPEFSVTTIGSRFSSEVGGHKIAGIPPLPPMPVLPWAMAGQPHLSLSLHTFSELIGPAFAIAMLGAIESLLAAVVADGMTGTKHDPNAELLGLGIANILCPLFGGIAATGALARTATNIRAGARSPIAAAVHSIFVLLCTIALAPLVAYLPMAALAALLLIVARNMAEVRHFTHILRVAPRSDVVVLMTCFTLTVFVDMVVSVSIGVVLAALLFMRRMAEMTDAKFDTGTMTKLEMPEGVMLYEIAGPLFFGAAERAMGALETASRTGKHLAVILFLGQVPSIDATGLVALETALEKLRLAGHKVILTGMRKQVADVLERAQIKRVPGQLAFAPDIDTALSIAIVHVARPANEPPPRAEATA